MECINEQVVPMRVRVLLFHVASRGSFLTPRWPGRKAGMMVVGRRDGGDIGIQKYCAAPLRESSSHRVWGNADFPRPSRPAHCVKPSPESSSHLNHSAALQFRNDNITSTLLTRLYYTSISVHTARVSRQPPLIQHSKKATPSHLHVKSHRSAQQN